VTARHGAWGVVTIRFRVEGRRARPAASDDERRHAHGCRDDRSERVDRGRPHHRLWEPDAVAAPSRNSFGKGRRGAPRPELDFVWATVQSFAVLADTISSVENFIHVFIAVYVLLIFGYILMSWIKLPYSPWLNRIQRFLYDVCEPYLRLFRRILPPMGPLDLSPIIAIIALGVIDQLVATLLDQLR
jgi:YggT family protein